MNVYSKTYLHDKIQHFLKSKDNRLRINCKLFHNEVILLKCKGFLSKNKSKTQSIEKCAKDMNKQFTEKEI